MLYILNFEKKRMITKRKLYYSLSPSLRFIVRRLYYFPIDTWNLLTSKRDKSIPPQGMIFIGSGDYKEISYHYLDVFKEHCNLQPHHRILDVGCGIGRIAYALTKYINSNGSYEGFDIVQKGINWCKKHISVDYPNFNFQCINLKNDLYNSKSETSAKNFKFPYKENNFDLVILTSVFTHMLPDDVENYLSEIYRVLKPGGKCLVTFFILNEKSENYMASNPDFTFKNHYDFYSVMDDKLKEGNVAYREDYLLKLFTKTELSVKEILYGNWSGAPKDKSFDFQDTVILIKDNSCMA